MPFGSTLVLLFLALQATAVEFPLSTTPSITVPQGSTNTPPASFLSRLKANDEASSRIVDLHAEFEQLRRTPLLKKPLVSKGTVRSVGDQTRWDTVTPRRSSMLIGRTFIELYYPADRLIESYPVDQGFMDLAGVPMPQFSALQERFDIESICPTEIDPTCSDPQHLGVKLTPRSHDLRNHMASVQLLIDESRSIVTKVIIAGPDGDSTEITFFNIRLNSGVSSQLLAIEIPREPDASVRWTAEDPPIRVTGMSSPCTLNAAARPELSPLGIPVPEWACSMSTQKVGRKTVTLSEGALATMESYTGPQASLLLASMGRARDLTPVGFHDSVATLTYALLSELANTRHPHIARMWSFLPGIHDTLNVGQPRYEVFNKGRFEGFCRWFGSPSSFATLLPAASAVGHDHDTLTMAAIGTGMAGLRLENPRQTPAFRYSKEHGVKPPCFVRAVLVEFLGRPRLLVSGTASINGEKSLHPGSIERQTKETFRNLSHLADFASSIHRFTLDGVESARVYHPRASDRSQLEEMVRQRLPVHAAIEFIPSLICRPELLVEIEVTISPSSHGEADSPQTIDDSPTITT